MNGLWERYERKELPHIHICDNPVQNAFLDALNIQADRIIDNLINALPQLSIQQIRNACFRGSIDKEQE